MYMNDIKLFAKNNRGLEVLIQSIYREGVWHVKCIILGKSGKQHIIKIN